MINAASAGAIMRELASSRESASAIKYVLNPELWIFFFPLIANKIVTRGERQDEQSQDDGDSQKILPAFGDRRLAGSVKLRPGKRCRWRTRFRRSAPVFVERSSRRKDSTRRKKDLGSDKNRESHKKIAVHPSRLNPPALPQPPGPA